MAATAEQQNISDRPKQKMKLKEYMQPFSYYSYSNLDHSENQTF
jgi:hypothetical protein